MNFYNSKPHNYTPFYVHLFHLAILFVKNDFFCVHKSFGKVIKKYERNAKSHPRELQIQNDAKISNAKKVTLHTNTYTLDHIIINNIVKVLCKRYRERAACVFFFR